MDEVCGVCFGALCCLLGVVGELVAHVYLGAGDTPVAMTAGPALLVKVEIDAVPWIAGFAGPDLDAGAGVAGEDGGGVTLIVGAVDVVGLVEGAMVAVRHSLGLFIGWDGSVEKFVWRRNAVALFYEVSVDEEEFDVGLGEGLFDADTVEAGSGGGAVCIADGVVPEAGGAVAALGRPDALGMFADVADVGVDGGADLGTDTLVGAEERHVTVGCAAGDDVDEADVVEVTEAGDDVAVEVIEVFEGLREEAVPEAGGLGEVSFAGLDEEGLVFAGGDYFAIEIVGELCDEDGVRELLEEDGREVEIAVEADLIAFEIFEDAEKREIGFSGGFVEPLHTVRPGAVIDDVGQMRMQGEGEKSCWAVGR